MGSDFSIREHGDPSESTGAELFFRIKGVDDGEEALAKALMLYEVGRSKAGLSRDYLARPSLVPLARSSPW
ncbi:MAG: hypothetical protein QOE56_2129 [Solirubrobacterales bacterium]|nr:hypothetical protein [Solirubrobacterales bacterium]